MQVLYVCQEWGIWFYDLRVAICSPSSDWRLFAFVGRPFQRVHSQDPISLRPFTLGSAWKHNPLLASKLTSGHTSIPAHLVAWLGGAGQNNCMLSTIDCEHWVYYWLSWHKLFVAPKWLCSCHIWTDSNFSFMLRALPGLLTPCCLPWAETKGGAVWFVVRAGMAMLWTDTVFASGCILWCLCCI